MKIKLFVVMAILVNMWTISAAQALEEIKKQTICLNMIVKDESAVITRCLKSVLPIIDTWVIVDTGSTDDTQQIIKDFMKDVPGELYERPWVNFGHNRQEALQLAKGKADFILFMDADDMLSFSEEFMMPDLNKDFYVIASRRENQEEFWIHRLIRSNLDWYWEGAIHEDLYCRDFAEGTRLDGVIYLYLHSGDRANNPDTWKKDVQVLLEAIAKEPNNPRNYFYLARSYQNGRDFEHALEYYQKRADMTNGNPEEMFLSRLCVAKMQSMLQMDKKLIQKSLIQAYLSRPHRIEPLYYLANQLRNEGQHEKAYQIASNANNLPRNPSEFLAIEKWIYDYGLSYELACAAGVTGRTPEAIQVCKAVVDRNDIPADHRKEIEALYATLVQQNIDEINKNLSDILQPILTAADQ